MKTIDEVREEMGELEPIEFMEHQKWYPPKLEPPRLGKNAWVNKKRIHPIEWVFLGVMIAGCGFILIELVRYFIWNFG